MSLFIIFIIAIITITTTFLEITAKADSSLTENNPTYISEMLSLHQSKHNDLQLEKQNNFIITSDLKKLIRTLVENGTNAAVVIGLVDSNGTQFYSYGKTSEGSNATIVDENTIFNIGSITKTFTTILLADIVNEGKIKLDDPIENYLPSSVKVPTYNGQKITIEVLATHTSGLPENPPNLNMNDTKSYSKYSSEQLYQSLSNIMIITAPGTNFEYSNMGMAILGDILATKTGIPYEKLVKNRILCILGMNNTTINLSDPLIPQLALGHIAGKEIPITSINLLIPPTLAPAGSFRSSAIDLLKYISANIQLMKTKLNEVMENTQMIRSSTNINGIAPYDTYIGLGWVITTNFGSQIIWHNGEISGYNSIIAFNPANQRGVVIICSCTSQDIDIANIGFGPHDKLSKVIWDLLLIV